jgi:hypothetical protein
MKGEAVTVSLNSLSPGSYRLVAGLDDSAVRGDLAAVELTVSALGGAGWKKHLTVPDRKGLHLLTLPRLHGGQSLKVEVRAEETGARFFCWDLERSAPLRRPKREAKEPPAE